MLFNMELPSKLCPAQHGQSNVGSMCDCKPCGSFDLSVLVEILTGVATVTMVQVPEGIAVSIQSQHYVQYKEGLVDQR